MDIFISNIPFKASDEELRQLFEGYGHVKSCKIIRDRDSGRSRGYGFVDMPDREDGLSAISSLDGKEMMGRKIKVKESSR